MTGNLSITTEDLSPLVSESCYAYDFNPDFPLAPKQKAQMRCKPALARRLQIRALGLRDLFKDAASQTRLRYLAG